MITSAILGRSGQLGNQIFQYAVLVGIQKLKGYEIKILSDMPNGTVYDTKTGQNLTYSLSLNKCFEIPEEFVHSSQAKIHRVVSESHYHFDPNILLIEDGVALWGYFESERYFSHAEDELRSKLKFKQEILSIAKKRISQIRGEKPLVSVHIRRGQDRPGIQEYHPFLDASYYRSAFSHFEDCDFIIFTDDPEWCIREFPDTKIFEWENSYSRPDFIDLCAMSLCDHHIIANSTFSWWGAWLNPSKEKKVVAPSKWFGPKKIESNGRMFDISDNTPISWVKI